MFVDIAHNQNKKGNKMENTTIEIQEWDNKQIKSFLRKDMLLRTVCSVLIILGLASNIYWASVIASMADEIVNAKILVWSAIALAVISGVSVIAIIIPALTKKCRMPLIAANCFAAVVSTVQLMCFLHPFIKEDGFDEFYCFLETNSGMRTLCLLYAIPIFIYAAAAVICWFMKKIVFVRGQVVSERNARVLSHLSLQDIVSVRKLYHIATKARIAGISALTAFAISLITAFFNTDSVFSGWAFLIGVISLVMCVIYSIGSIYRKSKLASPFQPNFTVLKLAKDRVC